MRFSTLTFAAMLGLLSGSIAVADQDSYTILINDHHFQPETLTVPAGQKVRLIIENQDATPEEFESHDLRLEKIIPGGSKGSLWIGPLAPGEYTFFGEFHEDTAQGRIIVK